MKYITAVLIWCSVWPGMLPAQPGDSPETLAWVAAEARKIDSTVNDALKSPDPSQLFLRMLDAYFSFEHLVYAGLYCTEARIAAEAGRAQSDLINYRRDKDWNSLIVRALETRKAAIRLQEAVAICRQSETTPPAQTGAFRPSDILRADALIVELDLTDGLASGSTHLLAQKVDHAIKVLHEAEYLAASLPACSAVERAAIAAADACSRALQSRNWLDIHRWIHAALKEVAVIKAADCR